ncbi:hypothetical protein [Chroococcidiopsis sp. SAG 2025]|uniref:hypothetical protein n=1 Tax=Chroococcidiopsis sp. SAG 2025 TaxID=171389 RepID=UPI0029370223|nr:hypothetical protein [Chroococcidiopsis sp. SAG 2025]
MLHLTAPNIHPKSESSACSGMNSDLLLRRVNVFSSVYVCQDTNYKLLTIPGDRFIAIYTVY